TSRNAVGEAGVLGQGLPPEGDDSQLLVDIVRATLTRETTRAWKVEPAQFWCTVTPLERPSRDQGRKPHVPATLLAAPVVLARVAEVLVRAGCMFKFARGLEQLGELLSNTCERGSGGKFVTAYPSDDEQFRQLAVDLDRVTDRLPGPAILSDRPV